MYPTKKCTNPECIHRGELLPLNAKTFHRNVNNKDGFTFRCKDCKNQQARKHNEKYTKEQHRERKEQHRKNIRAVLRERQRELYERNKKTTTTG